MNYLKKIIIFFLIGISVNCEEITRINNNVRDDKNWLSMEIEKDEKIKILKTKQKLSLCLKKYNLSNFLVSNCSLLIDKDKIKEFTIKEDELKNYSDEIKNLVKQLDKKMYLSKGISVIPFRNTYLPETTFFDKIIDSEVIIYLSKDFNYYLDLYEYEKMKKKMEKIDDFQDKLKKIEEVAEYIYSKKEEYESIVNYDSNFRIYLDLHKYLNFSKKEASFEDWFLDTYYYSLNEDLIKLYNLLENNKK